MYLKSIKIKNFRLLRDVTLNLEENLTLIVGRNNSGKTSLTEIFRRLLGNKNPSFELVDISLSEHSKFIDAYNAFKQGENDSDIRVMLPRIEIEFIIDYSQIVGTIGNLSEFIVDLDKDCKEAKIIIHYELESGKVSHLFEDCDDDESKTMKKVGNNIPKLYKCIIYAQDPNDDSNYRVMEWSEIKSLIFAGFISAQRGLTDETVKGVNQLGNILVNLYNNAKIDITNSDSKNIIDSLKKAVDSVQEEISGDFKNTLEKLLPSFKFFGYPSNIDPKLLTETVLNIEDLISKDHTHIFYDGINGINLPEAYNGLGNRNLIYMMLKLYEFSSNIITTERNGTINVVFIEEPEVHLHPQMQQVFIRNLTEYFKTILGERNYNTQFIITTHSSHIANEAHFDTIRYFFAKRDVDTENACYTSIKNLNSESLDKDFLHKYMTLTKCDLLFADKAILIEGATERLMLPKIIDKLDKDRIDTLKNQYVSTIEIGGAYGYIFIDLLKLLELKSLIITDLDAAKINGDGKRVKSMVSKGICSTNATINRWFNSSEDEDKSKKTIKELIEMDDVTKTNGIIRIAYQIPENSNLPCGRSFEEAFILANLKQFNLNQVNSELEQKVFDEAKKCKKTDFAIHHSIESKEWIPPRYIFDGLKWLASNCNEKDSKSNVSTTKRD